MIMENIRYMTEDELILLNQLLIRKYSPDEVIGVKIPELLNSAVNRPMQSVFGDDAYKTIFAKAAALFESLAQNHAFHNGNKRVAFVGMVQFMKYNKYRFVMEPKDAIDFTINVVEHKYSLTEIESIIKEYSKLS